MEQTALLTSLICGVLVGAWFDGAPNFVGIIGAILLPVSFCSTLAANRGIYLNVIRWRR